MNHPIQPSAPRRSCGRCWGIVMLLAVWVCGWASDATVSVPVTGPVVVSGGTVTLPAGEIAAGGDLIMDHQVASVLQAGVVIRQGGQLRIRLNTPPTVSIPPAVTPNPVTGTTATLSVLGADSAGEGSLTYTWSTTGAPPAAVVFSANGTNAAKTTTATFSASGSYAFQVAITDAGGQSVTAAAASAVVVGPPTLTTIAVSPMSPNVFVSTGQTFTAVGLDQFGAPLSPQPTITWTVSGGGTIGSTTGVFTANATAGGPYTVTVSGGGKTGTTTVTVLANTAPTVATAAAATPSPVTGTATTLSVLGADDFGEPALTYTWATTGTPPAPVTFSANGTNAAKSTTATFGKIGTYNFQVTIRDAGNKTVTSTVSVVVSATLASVVVTPTPTSVVVGLTRQFAASGKDQFGATLGTQPTWTWTVSGGGTISATGLYTAGTTPGGPFTVSAASGGVTGTASVTVAANTAPTIVAAAAASPAPVTAKTTVLTATGTDDGGDTLLKYTWSTVGTPPATVSFSANGTNAAKTSTATFIKAGSYTFRVTIADTSTPSLTVTSDVVVQVNQTLTTITLAPTTAAVQNGLTQQFTPTAKDQFAVVMAAAPTYTWTASGGGTISATGLFTADSSQVGLFTIRATSGGVIGESQIRVADALWASLPSHPIYMIATETDYPTATTDPNASDRLVTSYAYQWHPSSNQFSRITTTLPIVTTATNGPNTASTIDVVYDLAGRPVWIKDADGYVHYRAYDAFTGAATVSIDDANTTLTGAFATLPPFTTPPVNPNPVAGGAHLVTQTEVDLLGRPTRVIDPAGGTTYTVYNDAAHEVRVYPGWDATSAAPTGPTRVAREDWAHGYREVLTMSALPLLSGGRPTGQESISLVQSLRREILDDNGRVGAVDTYVDLSGVTYSATSQTLGSQRAYVSPPATPSGAYERESYTYATRGFPERRVRANGTIDHQVTDVLGRVIQRWTGTDATGWTSGQTTDLPSFKLVAETVYDNGGLGLGLPTLSRVIGDDAAGTARVAHDTTYRYDARGRLVATRGPDAVLTTITVDNLDRPTLVETWAGVAAVTDTPVASALRGREATAYDALGQAWRIAVTAVQGADGTPGTVGNTLYTQRWFDRRGYLVKSQTGTAGVFSKTRYDGAGRAVYAWTGSDTSDGTSWTNARSSSGDSIIEATMPHFDTASNVVASTRFIRKDNATTTGDLTAGNSHLSVQVRWLDKAYRQIGVADYGRDNGTTRYVWSSGGALIATNGLPTEATAAAYAQRTPNSSDDYRVTRITYDAAGRPWQVTDNLGRVRETQYDAAGRVVKTIGNRVDGIAGTTETETDQIVSFVYAVGGGIAERHTIVANGVAATAPDQVTRYLRTSAIDRSWVTAVIYPDSTETVAGGTNQVQTSYDRLGRPRTRTDQRGVVRTFTYDAAGRLASDAATTIPAGVDGYVQRLDRIYDDLGRLRSRSSWSAPSGGVQRDEVRRSFDGWGSVTATAQAHDGAVVAGSTPSVGYTWDEGATSGTVRSLRLTAVSYPSLGQGVAYRYPTSGVGFALDRPEAITSGGVDILTAEYLGAGILARQTLPRAGSAKIERSSSAGAGGYTRYWQVGNHAWVAGTTQLDGGTAVYDRGGRVTARLATWTTSRADRDDVATYDGLDRVKTFKRGQASGAGVLADTATRRDWTWTLDQAGNWRTYGQDSNGGATAGGTSSQARSHNLANEIDTDDDHGNAAGASISGSGVDWIDPVYDAAGAMTTVPMPGAETTARTLVWDAWGRLVGVTHGATSVWTGRYDAGHRLIRTVDVAAAKTSDYYLDESAREVEVRVGGLLAEVYVWGSGDQVLRVGTGTGGSITTYYGVLADQQGSVTALVQDGTSTVLERYRYDAYGGRTIYAADGTTVRGISSYGMRYAFQGRPFDPTTGLGYFRYRWYHSSLGRWISRDPAGYVDGGNLYQAMRGNMLWWTDPWGLEPPLYRPQSPTWMIDDQLSQSPYEWDSHTDPGNTGTNITVAAGVQVEGYAIAGATASYQFSAAGDVFNPGTWKFGAVVSLTAGFSTGGGANVSVVGSASRSTSVHAWDGISEGGGVGLSLSPNPATAPLVPVFGYDQGNYNPNGCTKKEDVVHSVHAGLGSDGTYLPGIGYIPVEAHGIGPMPRMKSRTSSVETLSLAATGEWWAAQAIHAWPGLLDLF